VLGRVSHAAMLVNTVPGPAFSEASTGPALAQSTTAIERVVSDGRRVVCGLGSVSVAVTNTRRLPGPVIPSASVASVARQVSAPAFVIGLVANDVDPGFRYERTTPSTPVRSVARTLTVTDLAALLQ